MHERRTAPAALGVIPRSGHRVACLPLLLASLTQGACLGPDSPYARERNIERILAQGLERGAAERASRIEQPRLAEEPSPAAEPAPVEARVLELDLERALATAVATNRDYIAREESLVLAAISLANSRHAFSPRISATLSTLFAGGEGLSPVTQATLGASLNQALAQGGNLALSASANATHTGGEDAALDDSSTSGVSIRLTQPLLRGAGSTIALEELVQAERNLMYSVREFELFREDFAIEVAGRYFGLVRQKQSIENQRRNLEGVVFGRRQAEALFAVGRTSELDVLRARRSELSSQNDLIEAEEAYELELDRLRIFLGLPSSVRLEVADDLPQFVPCNYDLQSAILAARNNRLDLWNRRESLEDAERSLRIARDRLGPDLNLNLAYGLGSTTGNDLSPALPDQDDYAIGLDLEFPLDRRLERNSLRATELAVVQARRSYEEFLDQLEVEIESAFRELERRKQSLEIQRQLIADQERNVKIAQLRFEQGDFSNRDVVEAQEALLEAQNSLLGEQVSYEIARLELLRNLGILFIDEQGMWVE